MNGPDYRTSVAASETEQGSEGKDARGRERLAEIAHQATYVEFGSVPIQDLPSPYELVERAVTAIWAAGYRLVSEDPALIEAVAAAIRDAMYPGTVDAMERRARAALDAVRQFGERA